MNDRVQILLIEGPLPRGAQVFAGGAGALLQFEGAVRPEEAGQPLAAIHYEAYEPMTTRELHRIAEQMLAEYHVSSIRVEHSIGRVRVGEVSFRLTVCSPHRAEALAATAQFIDAMKQQVPLWKVVEMASI